MSQTSSLYVRGAVNTILALIKFPKKLFKCLFESIQKKRAYNSSLKLVLFDFNFMI
jgi:hypothetical protein